MQQPVDLTNVRDMIGDDPETEAVLFTEFIRAADEGLAHLAESIPVGDHEKWRKTAHMLKGIAYNIGAYALGDLCKLAQEGANISASEKQHVSSLIRNEYSGVKRYLEQITCAS